MGEFVAISIAKGNVADQVPEGDRDNFVDGISGATMTGRFLSEAYAQAVKIEGGVRSARTTEAMLDAFRALKSRGGLDARIYVMLDWTEEPLLERFYAQGPEIDPAKETGAREVISKINGKVADLALFDPEKVAPRATYKLGENGLSPVGMPYVIVNGTVVVEDSQVKKDVFPGKPVRRPIVN